jgi:hypothetical protein
MGSYFVYGYAAVFFLLAFISIRLGIRAFRNTESSFSNRSARFYFLRAFYEIGVGLLLVFVYSAGILGVWWSVVVVGFLFLPVSLYELYHEVYQRKSRP